MTKTKKIQHQCRIPESHANNRLDQALAKLLPAYSRTQIKSWLGQEAILVDGKVLKARTRVHGGEWVTLEAELKAQPEWLAQAMPLQIIYEDNALLVIEKPAGCVVHPGAGNPDHTLLNALLHHAPSLQKLPRAGILHRLDKNTSGLMVVAKTGIALRYLAKQIKERSLLREYQAIVCGRMISGGQVNAPLGRHPLQRKRMAVVDTGKFSLTHYRIMEKFRAHTRLRIKLETGRTHQIRVHMAHIRHPIVGDPVYGGRLQLKKGMLPELITKLRNFKRQALHAFALGFIHPETNEWMQWESNLPADMKSLIAILREDVEHA